MHFFFLKISSLQESNSTLHAADCKWKSYTLLSPTCELPPYIFAFVSQSSVFALETTVSLHLICFSPAIQSSPAKNYISLYLHMTWVCYQNSQASLNGLLHHHSWISTAQINTKSKLHTDCTCRSISSCCPMMFRYSDNLCSSFLISDSLSMSSPTDK